MASNALAVAEGSVEYVPASSGSRLTLSWGTGKLLNVCEVLNSQTNRGGESPAASICNWWVTDTVLDCEVVQLSLRGVSTGLASHQLA